MEIIIGIIIFTVLSISLLLFKSIYLVTQAEVVVIERFGKYNRTLVPGFNLVVPFVDNPCRVIWTYLISDDNGKHYIRYSKVIEKIDLRESVYDFPKQNVITRDNVTMEINALLYYQITDPKAAVYEVSNLPEAIEKLTQTTLRNVIGSMDLDESLVSRDSINEKLRVILDEATDKWGVKVNRVELQEVKPPADIRQAMEKQMRAERDRRAIILAAEGSKRAAILEAEGMQESSVLRAKGEAEARIVIAQAETKAVEIIKAIMPEQDPLPYLIAMQYIKALPEMAKGKNDKLIVVPYEATSLIGSLSSIKTIFDKIQ
ncbi:MAG: SPFH domain-containing protein [Candidatus Babeliales bacterium]